MLAVLLAAFLHAVWNSLAHAISDRVVGFALIGVVDALGGATMIAVGGLPPTGAWPFIIASAAVHVLYNLLLLASYQLGEFSQMYPLARGTSPWLVAVVALVVLGHDMPVTELAGVLTISAGLIALVFLGGRPTRKDLPALGAATLTGVTIAGYTVIDGVGVQQASLLAYTGWMFLLQGPPLAIFAAIRRGPRLLGAVRDCAVPGLAGGAISLGAYTIVLAAQRTGALAPIAALRETSIVFGALIGAFFLGERLGARRAIASAVVLAGVLLISLP
ncbi:EamA family transporter [Mycolicibacterium goodii]|uniref:DMT family transporter n=1 Tax=Mycolicibacterium goodii TaxID=134601 RepID=A0ABS6HIQ1_MYCGD|nr:EamA family transporter [Mycolicibacterium goodii]MBU8811863.1 DMT family transporter [Mycolicibacterium goodii]MBU8814767.1 DMT family transporter [Mycolicibacterium goodii]MBU8822435.1 DMT family transporter [Mycolicibacterium goodii]MBU8832962.1 DMT family transporter [Mycolicibacterium goodii]MBU8835292.1 DMT family transporter [Mycolicibacterium goodii]